MKNVIILAGAFTALVVLSTCTATADKIGPRLDTFTDAINNRDAAKFLACCSTNSIDYAVVKSDTATFLKTLTDNGNISYKFTGRTTTISDDKKSATVTCTDEKTTAGITIKNDVTFTMEATTDLLSPDWLVVTWSEKIGTRTYKPYQVPAQFVAAHKAAAR